MKELTELQIQRYEQFRASVRWGIEQGLLSVKPTLNDFAQAKDLSPDLKKLREKRRVQIET